MVVVTGLSGAGKSSILRVLEDLGYEVVDNPPLPMIEEIAARAAGPIAVGVDSRTRDFDPASLVAALARLRGRPGPQPELIYATADDAVLLRRFTATRRRHPLATHGNIAAGIVEETALTAPLRGAADIVLDTTDLPPPELRQIIEARFGLGAGGMTLSLMSFAFPAGIPREADMVFDARFLRNPHYVPDLAPRTGLEAQVADYVGEDPDYQAFFRQIEGLLRLVLPRFVAEGKKYATVAVGCSGGRHRSVTIIEALARSLGGDTSRSGPHDDALDNAKIGDDLSGAAASVARDWPIIVTHRELARQGLSAWRWVRRPHGGATPVQQRGSDPK
ncbi:ATPase [Ameyamaea chiangmaiensis NBRC 103196]|nr:RNase adapter RapZ [Ameyamaea chiangmaiensis]GBQ66716.1 ATPase [Ameyamaea chiangmaiensis NBRC 103196]